jgi:ubiquinone/menaquinone biosynthesis C-methylase UbiE
MPFSDYLLYRLAKLWPAPNFGANARIAAAAGTEEHERAYARDQFDRCVRNGIGISLHGQTVLEVGCGHGGISCFAAVVGAKRVVGIDVNTTNLNRAQSFAAEVAADLQVPSLPVEFLEMDAYALTLPPDSFDIVLADNSFEHFLQPQEVMRQSFHVLRPGGRLVVPGFSSIYSKYGLHLKNGIKMPWANLVFRERTIVRAMQRLAAENPTLETIYPGLRRSPQTVADLRKHGDLNDITYRKFIRMAEEVGFAVERFHAFKTHAGYGVAMLPWLKRSILRDIFSTGATAILRKPGAIESAAPPAVQQAAETPR